jgi:hypothetical protein
MFWDTMNLFPWDWKYDVRHYKLEGENLVLCMGFKFEEDNGR